MFLYLKNNSKTKRNNLFFGTVLGSFLWGIGYSLLIVQSSVDFAVICRAVGLLGAIMFAICGVNLVADMANVSKKFKNFILVFSSFEIVLYPFLIMPSRLVYKATSSGMNYEVTPEKIVLLLIAT